MTRDRPPEDEYESKIQQNQFTAGGDMSAPDPKQPPKKDQPAAPAPPTHLRIEPDPPADSGSGPVEPKPPAPPTNVRIQTD